MMTLLIVLGYAVLLVLFWYTRRKVRRLECEQGTIFDARGALRALSEALRAREAARAADVEADALRRLDRMMLEILQCIDEGLYYKAGIQASRAKHGYSAAKDARLKERLARLIEKERTAR